ncbi:MAG TPA: Na+/H+ antiporter [Candidatus Obscuribacterales bacterium]
MEIASNLNVYVLLALIMIASAVAIAIKWVKLPYSIALVLVGLCIGIFHLLPPVSMSPQFILVVFLPALLFEAAWNLDWRALRTTIKPVAVLATLGVFVSATVVGFSFHILAGVALSSALVFGAIVSATDPISVLSLFKKMGVERRLTMILEGESLVNDGTAVALFRVLLACVVANQPLIWTNVTSEFLLVTLVGTLVGAVVGYGASFLTKLFDDHLLELTLTLIVAYGSYLLAEQLQVSSVISVLSAGFVIGNYGSRTAMSASTRLVVNTFWEYAAFLSESLLFLLIGMQMKIPLLITYAPLIGTGILSVLLSRIVVVYVLTPFASTRKNPIPLKWRHILFWGGLRGSLCLAMALSLPSDFPYREPIVVTSFGVALFTLLFQGLTMEPLVKVLGVRASHSSRATYLDLIEDLQKQQADLMKLEQAFDARKIQKKKYSVQKKLLEEKRQDTESMIIELQQGDKTVAEFEEIRLRKALLEAQKDCVNAMAKRGIISASIIESYLLQIDAELDQLKQGVSGNPDQETSGGKA